MMTTSLRVTLYLVTGLLALPAHGQQLEPFVPGYVPSWESGIFVEVGGRAGVVPQVSALTFGLRYEQTGIGHPMPWQGLSSSSWTTSSLLGVVGVQL